MLFFVVVELIAGRTNNFSWTFFADNTPKQDGIVLSYGDALIKDDVMELHSKVYKRYMGRAFRSYWRCIHAFCGAQLMLSDLKGGSIKILSDHNDLCQKTVVCQE